MTDAAFRSWIDAPAHGWAPSDDFVVRGWCYHRLGQPITGIRLQCGPETFAGRYGQARPDVVMMFGAEAGGGSCGFEVPVTIAASASDFVLQAQLAGGGWQDVQVIVLNRSRSVPWRHRLKAIPFLAGAGLGRPEAWSLLSASDRDVALEYVRSRGWFNLSTEAHHPPRPVAPERFPSPRATAEQLPQIGIVTPSFQQAAFLPATIASVLGQENVRIAYAVQDGGSTDGSADIIRAHAAQLAHWESAPDSGQADAILRGFSRLSLAADDVMMFLNSDDTLMSGAVHFVADYFARHPEVDVVYGHRVLIDRQGREVGRWFTPRVACADLRFYDLIPQETLFWRRRVWDRVGGIDRSYRFALDWDLLLRFRTAGARFARLPWFLGCFRLHPDQKTETRLLVDGIPENDALRRRTLGREPLPDELHLAMRRAQIDSALVHALFQRGWRI